MFKSADGSVRMRVNARCKHTIAALEQTIYKPGTREVDKSHGPRASADALGYCIDIEFPVRNVQIRGFALGLL
jgi:hypothetical protein